MMMMMMSALLNCFVALGTKPAEGSAVFPISTKFI